MNVSKILPSGKKVIFCLAQRSSGKEIFISDVRIIEKGKRKAVPLWQPYSTRISIEEKNNLVKEVFGFENNDQLKALLVELRQDYIDLTVIELESFGVSL